IGIVGGGLEAVEPRRIEPAEQALRCLADPTRTYPQRAIAAFGVEALDIAPGLVAQDQRHRVVDGNRRILRRLCSGHRGRAESRCARENQERKGKAAAPPFPLASDQPLSPTWVGGGGGGGV